MAYNPKSLENIKNHCYKSGQSGNPNGRPKSRVQERLKVILPKGTLKKRYALTGPEINEWEQQLLSLTPEELKAIVQDSQTPSYAKGLAVAILTDMKNGLTRTISMLRERQYGSVKQQVEVTGANGAPLIQQKNLTPKEAKDLIEDVLNQI